MHRRDAIRNIGATAIAPALFPVIADAAPSSAGRLKQSVSYWPYGRIPLPQFAAQAKTIGLSAIDLLQPEEWPVVREAGLVCSMGYPSKRRDFLTRGFNNPANHDLLVDEIEKTLPLAAQAGVPNVIAMFGNRNGIPDDRGAEACIAGLSRVKASAERHGVTVCVELLNSKVDHKDYMGDQHAVGGQGDAGRELAAREAAVRHLPHADHGGRCHSHHPRPHRSTSRTYHTGGVPGRNEIDDGAGAELSRGVRAIADAGFTGYVAHEFVPKRDPLTSLAEAFKLCDV